MKKNITKLKNFIDKHIGKSGSIERETFENNYELFKVKYGINKECKFTQGYIAAIAIMIKLEGCSNSLIEEAYKAGIGNDSIDDLISKGCDLYDIDILKKNLIFFKNE